jgi:hypothetical protein
MKLTPQISLQKMNDAEERVIYSGLGVVLMFHCLRFPMVRFFWVLEFWGFGILGFGLGGGCVGGWESSRFCFFCPFI